MGNKSEQLGIPFGTACHRLRKLVLFSLLKKHNENICFKCGKIIDNVDDLSMEHKKAWLNVSVDLFWDLDNITYSHSKCNHSTNTHNPNKKIPPNDTMSWCSDCQDFLPKNEFANSSAKWSGKQLYCHKHHKIREKERRDNK